MIGAWEIVLIFLVILLIFGGKKIPEIARGLGKGLREFKKAKDEITDDIVKIEKTDSKVKDDKEQD
ncbi:MAG TPA: twin-arginine translocase TatA/TatE family subunit [Lentisphaeria bacterium]|nr:MAG: preprotein translocase subunit TatA [Lentisphaerae bacterium GWF2_38_69]HBM16110.1 twin-arginine translocase TatA/TatE family subunit [Lentisphaeria bacterium]